MNATLLEEQVRVEPGQGHGIQDGAAAGNEEPQAGAARRGIWASVASEPSRRETYDTIVADSLKPLSTSLVLAYLVLALGHQWMLAPDERGPMVLAALGSALGFAVLRWYLGRHNIASRWAHPLAVACALVVLGNSLLHLAVVRNPRDTTNVALVIIGCGCVLLSGRWLVASLGVALASWALLVRYLPPSADWPHYGFLLFAATMLSGVIQVSRRRSLDRLQRTQAQYRLLWDEHRASEQRSRLILAGAPSAFVVLDAEGRILEWNLRAERIFGWTRRQAMGGSLIELLTGPESRERLRELLQTLAARDEGITNPASWTAVRSNGQEFPAEITGFSVPHPLGAMRCLFLRDVSARKRTEQALQSTSEALGQQSRVLGSVLESMADGVIVVDESFQFVVWNAAATEIVGVGRSEVAPERYSEVFGIFLPDTITPYPRDQLPLVRAVHGEVVDEAEVFVRNAGKPDGAWLSVNARPLVDDQGRARGGLVVFRDVTASRRAQQLLAERAAELARSNAELQQFAYVASHDLQEPLRQIASYCQLLQRRYRGQFDQDADEFLEFAVDGARRMQTLINDLLEYSRLGQAEGRFADTDSQQALDQALHSLHSIIAERQAHITQGPLPHVWANGGQLRQLFQNLISNAIKFCPSEIPRIEIDAERERDLWRFSVRDNGIGIAPEFHDRVFLVFKRLHGVGEFPGTGIGLAVCKKIAEQHGGQMGVTSSLGKGSTFWFTLPVQRPLSA